MTRYKHCDVIDIETGAECRKIIDVETPYGVEFEKDGRRYARAEGVRRHGEAPSARIKSKPFLAHSLPFEEDVKRGGFTPAPHYVDGVPAFSTRRERDEFIARYNDNPVNGGKRLEWDQ